MLSHITTVEKFIEEGIISGKDNIRIKGEN
jgi:hypothetical protein